MILLGRVAGVVGLLGTALVFVLLSRGWQGSAGAPNAFDYLGAFVVFAMLLSWLLGIWHWKTRYPKGHSGRGLWGLVVVVGLAVGATAYWFVAPAGRVAIAQGAPAEGE